MVMDILHHPVRALATMVGGNKLATILSEPATARATADWTKAYRDALISPNKARAARDASRQLAGIIARQTGEDAGTLAQQLWSATTSAPTSSERH